MLTSRDSAMAPADQLPATLPPEVDANGGDEISKPIMALARNQRRLLITSEELAIMLLKSRR